MRLLIDLQGAQNNSRHRGIGRYSLSLSKAIARNSGEHRVFILLNGLFADTIEPIKAVFAGLIPSEHFVVFSATGPVSEIESENDWRRQSAEALREYAISLLSPDALLISSLVEGCMDDTVTSVGRINSSVVTSAILYDLIPLTDPDQYIGWAPAKNWYMGKIDSLRRTDVLFAISESAAKETIDLMATDPARVVNISSAADEMFSSANVTAAGLTSVTKRLGIKRRYLMHSSAFDPRKNFHGLVRAFAALPNGVRSNHQLVLVCKLNDASRQELQDLAAEVGLQSDELILTGFVSDEDLVTLYVGCHLFVFPSFHEGFGLPALEAMCCGVPTIGSNATSVPEVIGRKDALFDPASIDSMSSMIQKALTDVAFYESLKMHAAEQAKKFSWDTSAKRVIEHLACLTKEHASKNKHFPRHNSQRQFFEVISQITQRVPVSAQELVKLAEDTDKTEVEVARVRANAAFNNKLTWRIEGPFDSTYSLALLNRETARALEQLGHTVVLHSTEGPGDFDANPYFLSANTDLATMHARVPAYPHAKVDAASRNLYPPRVEDMSSKFNIMHHYAWEESNFPPQWVNAFNQNLDALTCLSGHVEKVMIDSGVSIPTFTTGCGVDHWERVIPNDNYRIKAKRFRFLHVSSCFPRKGIDVLLEAYGRAFTERDDVSLVVKTFPNPHNEIHALVANCRVRFQSYPDIQIIEDDLSDADLKSLYKQCDVLAAPSRAEGFGLPMAEAILTGLPVITTNWGGQLDFCTKSTAWLVDYSFQKANTHFDLFASVWAEPDVSDLTEALKQAANTQEVARRMMAQAGRDLLLRSFKWADVAARLIDSRTLADEIHLLEHSSKLGWISTWNTKCGIAGYSSHLLRHFPGEVAVLAPLQDELIEPDAPNCHRVWFANKEFNDFERLSASIDAQGLRTLVLQFNYGFFNFRDLSAFLTQQTSLGRTVVVVMHSTGDPEGYLPAWNWQLSEIIPSLSLCQRVLVHSINDMNRLKSLGLVKNVSLFPLGVIDGSPRAHRTPKIGSIPTVAAYGYCLPHKGLPELVQAASLMRKAGRPIRLRLVNAEYPAPVSADLVRELRQLAQELELTEFIEFNHDYLEDAESIALLQDASLVVFAYQSTNESASAAVRIGLASRTPVGVTPLKIFDDLAGSVHRFGGTTAEEIAAGIAETLDKIDEQSVEALAVTAAADRWREAHSFSALAPRLHSITIALARRADHRKCVFDGSHSLLKSQVGVIQGRRLHSSGHEGFLFHGPYVSLPAGRFIARVFGARRLGAEGKAFFDVTVQAGSIILAASALSGDADGVIAEAEFHAPNGCKDLEARFFINSAANCTVERLEIVSL